MLPDSITTGGDAVIYSAIAPIASAPVVTTISSSRIETVGDVLQVASLQFPRQRFACLRRATDLLSAYAGVPVSELKLNLVSRMTPGFRGDLKAHKYESSTVKYYCGCLPLLLRLATEQGWTPTPTPAEAEWKSLLDLMGHPKGFSGIAHFATAREIAPSKLTDGHLDSFMESLIAMGRPYKAAKDSIGRIRLLIERANVQEKLPLVSAPRRRKFLAVPIKDLPEPLRSEVRKVLKWKTDEVVFGRPCEYRIRPATAKGVESLVSRLFGYETKHLRIEGITCLSELVTEEMVKSYVMWSYNENKVKRLSFSVFTDLLTAMEQHPDYKIGEHLWFKELMSFIPKELESGPADRKAAKYLPYNELSQIPGRIANARKSAKSGTRRYALLVHDELLISFLLMFCWRQRNIRECRLGPLDRDNIAKQEIDPVKPMAKPDWVTEELQRNPQAKFWQIYFREHETKIGRAVRGIVPETLVNLLEEYITHHRPILLGQHKDPGTLFLNRWGGAMGDQAVTDLVGNLTVRYAGRRVTPHIFRDSFAPKYLDDNPEDYLSLSKILWHQNLQTTIEKYGRYFDESHGMCRAAAWLKRRKNKQ